MSISVEQITEVVLSLPSDARALLADRLAESLDPLDDDPAIRDAWAAEAVRRLEEMRSGKDKGIDGEEGLRQIRELLRK